MNGLLCELETSDIFPLYSELSLHNLVLDQLYHAWIQILVPFICHPLRQVFLALIIFFLFLLFTNAFDYMLLNRPTRMETTRLTS